MPFNSDEKYLARNLLDKHIADQFIDKKVLESIITVATLKGLVEHGITGVDEAMKSHENKIFCGFIKRFMFLEQSRASKGKTISKEQWEFQRNNLCEHYNLARKRFPNFPPALSMLTATPPHLTNVENDGL